LATKTHTRGAHTVKARDTRNRLTIVIALTLALDGPRLEKTWTMTISITLSIMAALVSTTPSLKLVKAVERSAVNVVPRLVEHRSAPAAKDWRGVASLSSWRMNKSLSGTLMPVKAMPEDKKLFLLRARLVELI
jgi:hypothetical protein